jgi:hypothetical protein
LSVVAEVAAGIRRDVHVDFAPRATSTLNPSVKTTTLNPRRRNAEVNPHVS